MVVQSLLPVIVVIRLANHIFWLHIGRRTEDLIPPSRNICHERMNFV